MNQLPMRSVRCVKNTVTPSLKRTASKIGGAKAAAGQLLQRRDNSAAVTEATASTVCPHLGLERESAEARIHATAEWQNALSYNEIPGPKPLPILGNTWRFVQHKTKRNHNMRSKIKRFRRQTCFHFSKSLQHNNQ